MAKGICTDCKEMLNPIKFRRPATSDQGVFVERAHLCESCWKVAYKSRYGTEWEDPS